MRIRRIVDLTHVVSPDIQVYPGDPAPVFTTHASVETDGFDLTHIHMGSQTGTHIDAPRHVRRDGAPVDLLPPDGLVARGVVFDVREYVDDASFVTPDMLRHEHVPAPGDIAIVHTGWARYFGSDRYFDHPVLSVDACRWLLERGVRVVGIDAPSIDATGDETLAAHHILAEEGAVICENLRNLEDVDFPDPLISLLPIPFAGLDGSPVRAVAIDIET
ncbi:cyclase family protein [Rhodococcus sp. Z13]|uniref:Cyclase family protein n=1 Tax=Rhodococcus sacchari TaxID=2962047 RepID=A0ACD4DFL0_9NOCA|nr:cyclase family protein [Rhodococcus sp. Z13]UYP18833.1 cyclase family protein [Rhodococcus sp. Z13]